MIRVKYRIDDEGPVNFKQRQIESFIWKRLVWSSNLLHAGLRWQVENDKRNKFWICKWLDDSTLIQRSVQQVGDDEL